MVNENNPGSFGSSRGLSKKPKKDKTRKSSSTRWIGRQLNDPYVLETQKRGYKSRAAFKLLQINEKYKFLHQGLTVVDLGCAPGGWLQIASQEVGSIGGKETVVGVDLLPTDDIAGCISILGDISEKSIGDKLINILGADHAGYIKRISSSVEALSNSKGKLICKVSQLVKLIKDKKPFKMSKRKGDYITVDDLINEVGKDAARFIMLSRVSDVELEFDFEKVKLKSKDNPLYYVQYSYARICSIFSNSKTPINNDYKNLDKNFEFNDEEIKIIRKLSEWPKCIETSINKLEPHRLTTYLYQLASIFHSYWNMGRDSEDFRFLDKDKKIDTNKAVLLNCILLVIKNGMEIIGVDTPENM